MNPEDHYHATGARCHGTPGDDPGGDSIAEALLRADWRGHWGKPLEAGDLLMIGGMALESLFHKPPLGPIPEYLVAHLSVYGCVAEYEDKIEELDRWKALQLSRWLHSRIGDHWCVGGKVYQLEAATEEGAASEKFCFKLMEDPMQCGK